LYHDWRGAEVIFGGGHIIHFYIVLVVLPMQNKRLYIQL
jgi:hypothetical protein